MRPLVDLIINGHAHCMEYLKTGDMGYADSHLNWVICGGSGFRLCRQWSEGPELTEKLDGKQERYRGAIAPLYRAIWS